MIYRALYQHVISHIDPELCHDVAIAGMDVLGRLPGAEGALAATFGRRVAGAYPPPAAPASPALTRFFPRPIPGHLGLAAGLDKDARAIRALTALGFGFVEVGTVTPRPQPGNDRPRLWRLMDEEGIRNRMGFNNRGAEAMARRLRALRSTPSGRALFIGVNIGKNKTTPAERAVDDYVECAHALSRFADYLVINVSSPNTPGLRDLQSVEALRPIALATLTAARESAGRDVPVLVKIAPDLADSGIDDVADLVRTCGLSGVAATNTTINHDLGEGGVSGPRLRGRALEVIARLRAGLGDDYLIIGCGGITDTASARALLEAGADLVQELTGFIYQGPSQPGRINRALANR